MSEQSYDNQTIEKIWQMAKNDLKSSLSPAIFNTWILPSPLTQIRIIDELKAEATISCMTAFSCHQLKIHIFIYQLKTALEKYVNRPLELNFVVGTTKHTAQPTNGFYKTDQRFDQRQEEDGKPATTQKMAIGANYFPQL
jgi:chromosomal replication initiation ATPase DnaA